LNSSLSSSHFADLHNEFRFKRATLFSLTQFNETVSPATLDKPQASNRLSTKKVLSSVMKREIASTEEF